MAGLSGSWFTSSRVWGGRLLFGEFDFGGGVLAFADEGEVTSSPGFGADEDGGGGQ